MRDKKVLWGGLIVFLLFIFILKGVKSPEKRILEYLKDKYKEEFVIELMGKRNSEVRAEVLPKKYIGTIRQYDSYYSSTVFVPPYGEIGDNYGGVLLKESTNEYFRPKLEELFGKNILLVLTLEGGYDFPDFKKEMEIRQKQFKERPDGIFSPLSGGIYIFGRVENEADREYYRKQIYEFIQYLKAENIFDYAYIGIAIVDERFLAKDFSKEEFLEFYSQDTSKTKEEYREKRKELIKKYNDSYKQTSEDYKKQKLASIRKSDLFGERAIGIDKYTGRNKLLSSGVYGDKYIASSSGRREWMAESNRISSDYSRGENIAEIQFREERW